MTAERGIASLLTVLPRWTLVGGKGGVGKTTCAAALATGSAASGTPTLLLTTDPARSLSDAIATPLGADPGPVPGCPGLDAFQLDAASAREAFLARWRETLITIVDRGTYLDTTDIAGLIDAALPGADEAMALLTLADLEADGRWQRIIVDTAPTGHTLRLLALPETFRALIELLDAMQGKHRFMVSALTHRYRPDAADAFLDEMRGRLHRLVSVLHDASRARVLLVARAEPVVVAETLRYLDALAALRLGVAAIVVNALDDRVTPEGRESLGALAEAATERSLPIVVVPPMPEAPSGLTGIAAWGESARAVDARALARAAVIDEGTDASDDERQRLGALPPARLVARALTIVGGKGGVGKTTVSCALAILTADADSPVLLVSTDPAPSVGDALGLPVGDADVPVDGVPGLFARQMDAAEAFRRLRDSYTARIDAVFDALVERGVDAAHDRRIVRDLLALAPPGIDELYALASLGETLEASRYSTIIVDPAPTGHLLRLLEMPALALDWSHRLMRLMLKYRELGSLGEASQELLAFARRTRVLQALLADPDRAGLLVVALDEPLVRSETVRLIVAARGSGIDVLGVLWNRATRRPSPLPGTEVRAQFVSEPVVPSPRGVTALRAWGRSWRLLFAHNG